YGNQSLQIARPQRLDKRRCEFSLFIKIAGTRRVRALHAATRTARELARSIGGAADNVSNFFEGYGKHVVQNERETFRRREPIEHNKEREPDGVCKQCLFFGINGVLRGRNGLCSWLIIERIFAARFA